MARGDRQPGRGDAGGSRARQDVEDVAADDVADGDVALAAQAAMIEVATSGSEVPAATMVRPMTSFAHAEAAGEGDRGVDQPAEPSTSSARPAAISRSWTPVRPRLRRAVDGRRGAGRERRAGKALAAALADQQDGVGEQQATSRQAVASG
jgi:hypothetical protein